MALPPLKQIITADTRGLEGALNRATRSVRAFAVAGAAALGAASGALVVMTGRAMTALDANAKLARAVGGTTAAVQALGRAADRAGVQQSELAAAATRLNQRLGEVMATGKGADDTFKALGITAQQLAAMDVDERFGALSDAMQRAGMSTQEMSYHLRQLGIRQSSVITLLQGGSAEIRRSRQMIEEFGVAVSEIDAAQIERTNDAIQEVGRVFEGLANQLAVKIAPALERFANQFTDLARAGGPLRTALDRVVAAADRLMNVLSQPETVDAFAGAVTGLADILAAMANGMVWVTQNLELFTIAAGAATIALVAMGGPVSAIVIAATAAAAAFVTLRNRSRDVGAGLSAYERAAREAEKAQDDLNEAMGVFRRTGAPDSAKEAIAYAQTLVTQARAAYEAAAAERELAAARLASLAPPGVSTESNPAAAAIRRQADEATREAERAAQRLEEANNRLRMVVNEIMNAPTGPAVGITIGGGGTTDDPPSGGGGGRGAISDHFKERLDALLEGLQTERETLEVWYQESLEILEQARADELISEEKYYEAKLRLQQEYNERSAALMQSEVEMRKKTFSDLIGLVQQFGQRNKAAAKVAVALNAAQRISEISANTAAAATRALAELGPVAGPPAAARITAYGMVQKGIAAASAALRMGGGGGSAGGGAGIGGGGAAGAGGTPALPRQNITIDLVGDTFSRNSVQELFEQLNRGLRSGYQIEGVLVR